MATFISTTRKTSPITLTGTGGERDSKDKKWKKVHEVKQKCGEVGSSGETGAQRCLSGRDQANKSPGIQTSAG